MVNVTCRYFAAHTWYENDTLGENVRVILHADRLKASTWRWVGAQGSKRQLQLVKNMDTDANGEGESMFFNYPRDPQYVDRDDDSRNVVLDTRQLDYDNQAFLRPSFGFRAKFC